MVILTMTYQVVMGNLCGDGAVHLLIRDVMLSGRHSFPMDKD